MRKYKAVALCRVSTSRQRTEGTSLQAQEHYIEECANYLNADIVKMWSLDVSSRKGKNLARKDLREIIAYCRAHKAVKYLILDEVDRFMRSVEEYYWWKVEFKKIGVLLAYAKMPEITHEDNPLAVMKELYEIFKAETSNHERITKTRDKMQARIDAGYYPGRHHLGYKPSEIKGLHVPDWPRFDQLQTALKAIAAGKWTMTEALKYLTAADVRLNGGKPLDMEKLKIILKEPYYCGTICMGSFRQNDHGLHEAMISKDEFEVIAWVARGQKAKFKVKKHNPDYPMNGLLCEVCFIEQGIKQGKFIGYRHNNGKPGAARKYYQRYHCRSCHKAFLRDDLHEKIGAFIHPIRLNDELRLDLFQHLRKAWSEIEREKLAEVTRLQTRLELVQQQKRNLALSLAENPDLKDDIREAIDHKKAEIEAMQKALAEAGDIEKDFLGFATFALDFVDNLKERWWDLDYEDRDRCELLLFPERLRIDRSGNVSTPIISPIYRYAATKKTPVGASDSLYGDPYRKKLAPITVEFRRWHTILEKRFEQRRTKMIPPIRM